VVFEKLWRGGTYSPADVEGEIVSVDAEHASYLVFCASEGHVRKGNGTLGTHVPFEDVRPSVAPVAAMSSREDR